MKTPYIINNKKHNSIEGNNADVYFFKDLAIKVPKISPASPNLNLKNEYFIHKKIYSNGYPTSEPYGIYPVKTISKYFGEERITDALFTERIHGKDLDKIVSDGEIKQIGKTCNVLDQEASDIAEKIRNDLGIVPSTYYHIHFRNLIYDKEKGGILFIDFGDWKIEKWTMASQFEKFFCGIKNDFRRRLFSEY